jgi:hypothetical protein
MVVRVWDTIPEPRERTKWKAPASVVSMCWLQNDVGLLILSIDGTMDIWAPDKVSFEEKRTLDLI